jgi:hypothetical protein
MVHGCEHVVESPLPTNGILGKERNDHILQLANEYGPSTKLVLHDPFTLR